MEAQAIQQAGLASMSWQATDQPPTRVDGQNDTCHILGNALYSVYHTRPGGTRQDVLAVLWSQEPSFQLNADATAWLVTTTLSQCIQERLYQVLSWNQELSATELTQTLETAGLTLSGSGASTSGMRWRLPPTTRKRW